MPVAFIGHGNPMNALDDNPVTRAWSALGARLPRPAAVLMVSAHWYVPGTHVTADERPRTIHDFGGFPRALYEVEYPAPGAPALAAQVAASLRPRAVGLATDWGLDHGAWSVLCHLFPAADVPVLQLSIDETLAPEVHYQIGRSLAPLREQGVLILGSGNVVHNLHAYAWGRHPVEPYDWAMRFDALVRKQLASGEHRPLVEYEALGNDARMAAPTPEHYLPLLYVMGAASARDRVSFPVEGFDGGSISMLSVEFSDG